jgi:hypothetical protein
VQSQLYFQSRVQPIGSGWKGSTEGVSDRFENMAEVGLDGSSQELIVALQGKAHRFWVCLPEFGTAFNIRKEKSDRSGRQVHGRLPHKTIRT